MRASFNYIVSIRIEGHILFVSASYSPSNFTDRSFTAKIVVTHNHKEKSYSLTRSAQGDIVQLGYKLLGNCTINIPETGNVDIKLNVVFEYDSGIGYSNGRAEIPVL